MGVGLCESLQVSESPDPYCCLVTSELLTRLGGQVGNLPGDSVVSRCLVGAKLALEQSVGVVLAELIDFELPMVLSLTESESMDADEGGENRQDGGRALPTGVERGPMRFGGLPPQQDGNGDSNDQRDNESGRSLIHLRSRSFRAVPRQHAGAGHGP